MKVVIKYGYRTFKANTDSIYFDTANAKLSHFRQNISPGGRIDGVYPVFQDEDGNYATVNRKYRSEKRFKELAST